MADERDSGQGADGQHTGRTESGRFAPGNDFARAQWFKPGQSGNPAGRAPGIKAKLDACLRRLAEQAPQLAQFEDASDYGIAGILSLARSKNPSVALAANKEILDRYHGSVPTTIARAEVPDADSTAALEVIVRDAGALPAPKDGGASGNGGGPSGDEHGLI